LLTSPGLDKLQWPSIIRTNPWLNLTYIWHDLRMTTA
jgi:hypothetical protein